MNIENLYPFLIALVTGAAYAGIWFVLKVSDPKKPTVWTDFDKTSFLITMCFGAGIGVFNVWTQSPLTQSGIEVQLLAYGTQIAVAREIVLTVYNWYQNRKALVNSNVSEE